MVPILLPIQWPGTNSRLLKAQNLDTDLSVVCHDHKRQKNDIYGSDLEHPCRSPWGLSERASHK